MRFSTVIYAVGLVATAVKAQDVPDQGTTGSMTIQTESEVIPVTTSTEIEIESTTVTTSAVVSGTNEPTPAEQERDACLAECAADDNDCRFECLDFANSVNPIADCQAACPKGNGTAEDNAAYQSCYSDCIDLAPEDAISTTTDDSETTTTQTQTADSEETTDADATTSEGGDEATATTTDADATGTETGAANAFAIPVGGAMAAVLAMLAL